jgi:hypothetical protein
MEADWEVEIGGGAAVIEAEWPGWIDLRKQPERASEIAEAAGFAATGKAAEGIERARVALVDFKMRSVAGGDG